MDSSIAGATLHPMASIGAAVLAVSDLTRSLGFYEQLLGFSVLAQNTQGVLLGTRAGTPLLGLIEQSNAQPQPCTTTGLYHCAIRVPGRTAFVRAYTHLRANGVRIAGSADHHVNEAFYLPDPDGNGLEVYRDRSPETWRGSDGQLDMRLDPLDMEQVLREGQADPFPWIGPPSATRIGHMHLRVGDLAEAEHFYSTLLGFTVTHRKEGAVFLAAGDYHHHLGVNVWKTQGAAPPPKECVGLRLFTLQLPDLPALEQMRRRLQATNVPFQHCVHGILVRDPWNDALLFSTERLTLEELTLNHA